MSIYGFSSLLICRRSGVVAVPRTRLTLWPPKPNELDSAYSRSDLAGFLADVVQLAGRVRVVEVVRRRQQTGRSAQAAAAASTTPEAPSMCPVNALVELTAGW